MVFAHPAFVPALPRPPSAFPDGNPTELFSGSGVRVQNGIRLQGLTNTTSAAGLAAFGTIGEDQGFGFRV